MQAPIVARAWSRVSNSSRQMSRCLSLPNQDSMKAWALGFAVAAEAMRDAEVPPAGAEGANGERRAVVGPEVSWPAAIARSMAAASMTAIASGARQRT
jgi:hypothetical protein